MKTSFLISNDNNADDTGKMRHEILKKHTKEFEH